MTELENSSIHLVLQFHSTQALIQILQIQSLGLPSWSLPFRGRNKRVQERNRRKKGGSFYFSSTYRTLTLLQKMGPNMETLINY